MERRPRLLLKIEGSAQSLSGPEEAKAQTKESKEGADEQKKMQEIKDGLRLVS